MVSGAAERLTSYSTASEAALQKYWQMCHDEFRKQKITFKIVDALDESSVDGRWTVTIFEGGAEADSGDCSL